jgi:hypothetical protein
MTFLKRYFPPTGCRIRSTWLALRSNASDAVFRARGKDLLNLVAAVRTHSDPDHVPAHFDGRRRAIRPRRPSEASTSHPTTRAGYRLAKATPRASSPSCRAVAIPGVHRAQRRPSGRGTAENFFASSPTVRRFSTAATPVHVGRQHARSRHHRPLDAHDLHDRAAAGLRDATRLSTRCTRACTCARIRWSRRPHARAFAWARSNGPTAPGSAKATRAIAEAIMDAQGIARYYRDRPYEVTRPMKSHRNFRPTCSLVPISSARRQHSRPQ